MVMAFPAGQAAMEIVPVDGLEVNALRDTPLTADRIDKFTSPSPVEATDIGYTPPACRGDS